MLEQMKQSVYEANRLLKDSGLVVLTWGNVSQIDRETGYLPNVRIHKITWEE